MTDFSAELTPPLLGQQLNAAIAGTSSIDLGVRGLSGANSDVDNAAILNAVNVEASSLGATLVYPPGIFQHSGAVVKNKTQHRGAGRDTNSTKGTVLLYTGTGDGVQINNPINSSTAANVSFEGITFKNANRNAGKACFADTGSTDIKFRQCAFIGGDRSLILDQSELVDVTECDFEAVTGTTCLIWIVNGADRTIGATAGFSNRISVQGCQLDGNLTTIGIVDDGGATHAFLNNNYNGCLNHIRAAGVGGLLIEGGEFESSAGHNIILHSISLLGTNVGSCVPVLFNCPTFTPAAGFSCVDCISVGQMVFIAPFFGNTTAAKVIGTGNVNGIYAIGLHNAGGGASFDGLATNHWEVDSVSGAVITNLPLKISGNQIVGARGAAVTDAVAAAGAPSQAEFNAFVTQFNLLLARVRAGTGHGLIA